MKNTTLHDVKKFSLFLILAFFAMTSFGQGGQTWVVCTTNTWVPPEVYYNGAWVPDVGQCPSCPTRGGYWWQKPNECWEMTIINDLPCALDFFWNYTLSNPCGDIVPADDKSGGPQNNLVPPGPGSIKTLFAYELKWPNCSENPNNCACPTHFKFRINPYPLAPFVPEPWPMLTAFPYLPTTTYITQIPCGSQFIAIHVTVTGPNSATFHFY
jgi:hypothetical protein